MFVSGPVMTTLLQESPHTYAPSRRPRLDAQTP
jgi:hypothetical protein